MKFRTLALATTAVLASTAAVATQPQFSIEVRPIGSYVGSGVGNGGTGIEIAAYDPRTRRVFAINAGANSVDVIDLRKPAEPRRVAVLDFRPYGGGVNSVAVSGGRVAVAVEGDAKTDPGRIVFLNSRTLAYRGQVTVGALPDMVTFTPDGDYLLVANEGEPSEDYSIDPEGSVSIVDLRNGIGGATVRTADFSAYVGQEEQLRAAGIRIFGRQANGAPSNAAQDFEPEYIAVAGPRAYVTLQENNAVAVVNIGQARIEAVRPLGFKDHGRVVNGVPGNGLDPSDRDGANRIAAWPVYGMFQPDAIATLRIRNRTYLLTANEGDARVYPTSDDAIPGVEEGDLFNEEVRVGSAAFPLAPAAFPDASTLKQNANLGRLNVTSTLGADAAGLYERIYAFGARSFSIWDPHALASRAAPTAPNVGLVWDSGAQLEQITSALYPDQFNASNTNATRDDRSDNKGPEPEGIAVGRVGPREYAFVGLERIGGVMVYDVTDPSAPEFVQYVNTRAFGIDALPGQDDRGAEGIAFVDAEDSPTGRPLLLVGNEVSQTLAVFEVDRMRSKKPR
jgi:hypothetical protein